MDRRDDVTLLGEVAVADREAFAELYRRHAPGVACRLDLHRSGVKGAGAATAVLLALMGAAIVVVITRGDALARDASR